MNSWRRGSGLLALAAAALSIASAASAADDEAEALKRAADRSDRIYAYDQAAWVSTDEMLRQLPDPRAAGIAGWIVVERADHLHVAYYRVDGASRTAVFTVEVLGQKVLSSHRLAAGEDASLTSFELRLIRAREAAAAGAKVTGCSGPRMNVVVLPPASETAAVPVYLLSAQVKTGEYPFGGHFEEDVAPDGTIVSSRAFTKGCLNMGPPQAQPGGQPAFALVTHLLDAVPTEIHVYLSRWMGSPLVVLTPTTQPPTSAHRTWIVDGDRISLARTDN